MTQRWFTELLLLHIPIILIPTQGIIPEWGWRGERRDLHWALGPEATGAIAIGATATSTSTTIITSTETPTETSTAVKLARAIGGSTTRNTGAMLPMATGKRRINSAVRVLLIALAAEPEHARVVAELEHDPVAAELVLQVVAELGHARVVVAEPELARGAAQLELVRAAAERVLGLVVGVPQGRARNRRRAPARVAAPTKWEIVAFPPEQVHAAVPSAVGEAVAAGILRVQAAAGVAPAWAAAPGTAAAAEAMAAAVAVVVAAVVVVVAAAAAAGGRR